VPIKISGLSKNDDKRLKVLKNFAIDYCTLKEVTLMIK
jgi:hypothetical protein